MLTLPIARQICVSLCCIMARFKLTIEYEGTRYAGWQVQKNAKTIQGELLVAAKSAFNTNQIELYGAGRTDAGVHATGQVAHLDVQTRHTPDRVRILLNDRLPHDINVLRVEAVPATFHARHDAVMRSYVYQVSRRRSAFGKRSVWWIRDSLNVRAMQAAAARLEGFHDFRAFTDPDQEAASTKVELSRCRLLFPDDELIVIQVSGSHFLWKMVRRIVGTLVEVGRGNLSPEMVSTMLEKGTPEAAPFTAPPSGLFLEKVLYPGEKDNDTYDLLWNVRMKI